MIEEKVLEETIEEIAAEAAKEDPTPEKEVVETAETKIEEVTTLKRAKLSDADSYFDCIEEIERRSRELEEFKEAQEAQEVEAKEVIVMQIVSKPVKKLERRLSNVERFYQEQKEAEEPRLKKKCDSALPIVVYAGCAFVITQFYLLLTTLFSVNLPHGLVFLISSLVVIASLVIQVS